VSARARGAEETRPESEAERAAVSDRNEWYAPDWLRELVMRFYRITIDVAASPESAWVPGNWLGPRHPDPARRDGLQADWRALAGGGIAWMNAPFKDKLAEFVEKAARESARGLTIVGLLPRSPRTPWWLRWVDHPGVSVYELPERLKMEGPHSTGKGAPFDMVIVVWDGALMPYSIHVPPRGRDVFGFLPAAATFSPFAELHDRLRAGQEVTRKDFARAAFQYSGLPAPQELAQNLSLPVHAQASSEETKTSALSRSQ